MQFIAKVTIAVRVTKQNHQNTIGRKQQRVKKKRNCFGEKLHGANVKKPLCLSAEFCHAERSEGTCIRAH